MRLASDPWHRRLRRCCCHSQCSQEVLGPYLPKLRRERLTSRWDFLSAWTIQQFLSMLSVSAFSSRCTIVNRVFWEHTDISFHGNPCWVRCSVLIFTWPPSATFFLNVSRPSSCDHKLCVGKQTAHPQRRSEPRTALPGLHGAVRNPASSPSLAVEPWVSMHKFLVLNVLNSSLVVDKQPAWSWIIMAKYVSMLFTEVERHVTAFFHPLPLQ